MVCILGLRSHGCGIVQFKFTWIYPVWQMFVLKSYHMPKSMYTAEPRLRVSHVTATRLPTGAFVSRLLLDGIVCVMAFRKAFRKAFT